MADEPGLTINANEDITANPIDCSASMDKGLCEIFKDASQMLDNDVKLGADANISITEEPAPAEVQPLTIK